MNTPEQTTSHFPDEEVPTEEDKNEGPQTTDVPEVKIVNPTASPKKKPIIIKKAETKKEEDEEPTAKCRSLFWQHIKALQIKRFHHSKRNKKGLLCEVRITRLYSCFNHF